MHAAATVYVVSSFVFVQEGSPVYGYRTVAEEGSPVYGYRIVAQEGSPV